MLDVSRDSDRWQCADHACWASRLTLAATFLVFLAVAVPAQLLGLRWRSWMPGAEGERSLLGGVRSAAYCAMSQLI